MKVADYKELRVYKLAFESAMEIFELSRKFPPEEKFSLTDQMRRSTRSVCANLAEAWRKRRYEAAFVSKLSDSDGEAAETEVHLDFALRCGYLPEDKHAKLRDQYDQLRVQLKTVEGQIVETTKILKGSESRKKSETLSNIVERIVCHFEHSNYGTRQRSILVSVEVVPLEQLATKRYSTLRNETGLAPG